MKEFRSEKWNNTDRLIVHGAGNNGRVIGKYLEKKGIEFFYVDEKMSGGTFNGKQILSYSDINGKDHVILGSGKYIEELYLMDIKRTQHIYAGERIILDSIELKNHSYRQTVQKYDYSKNLSKIKAIEARGIYVPVISVITTSKCTLKCEGCLQSLHEYKKREDMNIVRTIQALDNMLKMNFWIGELDIVGGEPFLNQKLLNEILSKYGNAEQISSFCVITNGTICPDRETLELLKKNKRIFVLFSNYGKYSYNQERAVSILDSNNIDSCIENEDDLDLETGNVWVYYGEIIHRNKPKAMFQKMFDECLARKYCISLLNGRLFLCGRIAHGFNMGKIVGTEYDLYLDFMDDEFVNMGKSSIKQIWSNWYENDNYNIGCEWCDRNIQICIEKGKQRKE